ncbi:Scr1 family TA system antitoxin-like transcriptional regulator [Nonomuraea sp. NPDC059007]|uniref:Scr1 family TA system antitoxin-like transcriptional regulator n=1 Tax=Nonomuraea sp. NPDC059007 TaxID=3346692 RepID=UPI00367B140E
MVLVIDTLDDQGRQPCKHHTRKIADLQHGSDWQVITWRHHRLRARAVLLCTVPDGLMSAFTIAELPEAPTTVSVDSAGQAEVSTDPDFVSLIWSRYDSVRTEAFRPGESLIMIKEARQQWSQET